MLGFLEQWERDGLENPALTDWLARFRADRAEAAAAFWDEVRRGIADAFAAGPESIPDALTPGQSGSLTAAK